MMRFVLPILAAAALWIGGTHVDVAQAAEVSFDRSFRPTKLTAMGPTLSGDFVLETDAGELLFRDDARLHALTPGTRYRIEFEETLLGDEPARRTALDPLPTQRAAR